MYRSQVAKINEGINKTGKVIIALGCSFVQAQGAIDMNILEKYPFILEKEESNPIPDTEVARILQEYPNLYRRPDGSIDFTFMEYENAFVNILCNEYFNGEYTPINLGRRGNGNRATIKDLYFHPEIEWEKINEYIVIYMPSGLERLDFVSDNWHDHFKWTTIWPHYTDVKEEPRRGLWKAYSECLWSYKFEVLEQLSLVQELLQWCTNKNARLITIPGFDRKYNKEYFIDALSKTYYRNFNNELMDSPNHPEEDITHLADLFPWHTMFYPQNCDNFADLAISQELPDYMEKNINFFSFFKIGSPDLWITACAHPSAKAHKLLAEELYKFICKSVV